MVKNTLPSFAALAAVLGLAAVMDQGLAYVHWSLGGAAFQAEELLAVFLYTCLLVRVAGTRVELHGRRRVLRLWLPLLGGVLVLFAGGTLMPSVMTLHIMELFTSSFFSMLWFAAGCWLLLTLAGRFLWSLPVPRLSVRTVGRLCLCILVGAVLQTALNHLFFSAAYGRGDGGSSALLPWLSGASMVVSFSVAYITALLWAAD